MTLISPGRWQQMCAPKFKFIPAAIGRRERCKKTLYRWIREKDKCYKEKTKRVTCYPPPSLLSVSFLLYSLFSIPTFYDYYPLHFGFIFALGKWAFIIQNVIPNSKMEKTWMYIYSLGKSYATAPSFFPPMLSL